MLLMFFSISDDMIMIRDIVLEENSSNGRHLKRIITLPATSKAPTQNKKEIDYLKRNCLEIETNP